jgi:DNA-binding FadR family transcriptional regulator
MSTLPNTAWLKPIAQTLPDQVAHAIVGRIASGDFLAGHRLPSQRDLAQSLGVGLAVVREALQRLAALNLVEANHGSGTVVRPFRWIPLIYDPSLFMLAVQRIGVADLWETRRLLEGQIVRLVVERGRKKEFAAIERVLARADPLPADYTTSQALNREFHLALARATKNVVLEDLLAPLLDIQVDGVAHRFTEEHCQKTWAAHWAIFEAVRARDIAAADRAVREHFKIGPVALVEIDARAKVLRCKGKSPPPGRRPRPA